jgi:PAS domain S-box-containing protein
MIGRRRSLPPLARAAGPSARARVGEILAEMVAGTASTGEAFFESLVVCLSRALAVRWAMVGELTSGLAAIRTLGFAADGALQPPATYDLAGTPCANVIAGALCHYPERVHELFPQDAMLGELGARSYLGVPLRSSRDEPIGILLVMHDAAIQAGVDPALILQVFASRAAAEVERLHRERERAAQEVKLRQSEEMFARMFHASPTLAVIVSRGGKGIVDVNDALLEAWGLRREEILGRTAVDLGIWTAEQRDAVVVKLWQEGRVTDHVVEIETRRGRRSVLLSAERIEIDGQAFTLVMGHDFTEHMKAEQELRRSEERWRRLSEAAFEGICIADDGRILDVNGRFAEMFGYTLEELIGMSVLDLAAPESREEVLRRVRSRSPEPYEASGLRRDGSRVPMELRGRDFASGGRTLRVTVVRDMTERKRLEADLRAAAREWNECFDAMPAGLVVADGEGRVRRANRLVLEWSGRGAFGEIVGQRIDALGAGEPWASLMRTACAGSAAALSEEIGDPRTDRSWRVAWSAFPRRDGDDPWTILVVREVTEEARLRDGLRRQETLAAMGRLVAGVAHEVRTPLFGISAGLDAYEGGTPEDTAEGARLLRTQVKRLSALMSDLLDYGRPAELVLETTAVEPILEGVVRGCEPAAREAGVSVDTDLARWLPLVRADRSRLEQAFQNLLMNAVQHTPVGSRVFVRARPSPRGAFAVECLVEDEGPGIEEASLDRVFEPFFSRRKGGTGLGLSIVQRIVEAHGGSIRAGNRSAGGAVFTVVLPAAASSLPREAGHV